MSPVVQSSSPVQWSSPAKRYIHFLLVGDTKLLPDWGFGILKHRFRSLLSCLEDLAAVINFLKAQCHSKSW